MLQSLFGNKNIQRILFFLFVNGKCYGTQLHNQLQAPLTPLQKALSRLEKGSIITSYHEGKTKLYYFNPAFPLLPELELLLKKAYTLLPPAEKKVYYMPKEDPSENARIDNKFQTVLAFWDRICTVKQLTFQAKSHSNMEEGWNGRGKGEVSITKSGGNLLIFSEKGSWQNAEGTETSFSNTFRWTLDRNAFMISLEHLRRGPDAPVFLFHLAPSGNNSLSSVNSHLCGEDTYFGEIHFDRYSLRLNWRVIGPKKNEEINYYYT